jgi:hypothetical protein
VDDYENKEWCPVKKKLLDGIALESDRAACAWIQSEIVAPIVVRGTVEGVLVATSAFRRWMPTVDQSTLRVTAARVARSMEAMRAGMDLDREHRTIASVTAITGGMGRAIDVATLNRLFLFGVTCEDGLGFSRAVLFESTTEKGVFSATCAVGATSKPYAMAKWEEIKGLTIDRQIEECMSPLPGTKEGDLPSLRHAPFR